MLTNFGQELYKIHSKTIDVLFFQRYYLITMSKFHLSSRKHNKEKSPRILEEVWSMEMEEYHSQEKRRCFLLPGSPECTVSSESDEGMVLGKCAHAVASSRFEHLQMLLQTLFQLSLHHRHSLVYFGRTFTYYFTLKDAKAKVSNGMNESK